MTPDAPEVVADLVDVWLDLPSLGSFLEIPNATPGEPGKTDFGYGRWTQSQKRFERDRTGHDIVLKSRQSFFSTIELARDAQYARTHDAVQVLIIADDRDEKAKFLARLKMMLDALARWEMVPPRSESKYDTKTEIVFSDNDSAIYITEAGASAGAAKKTGRSGTIHRFHGTEAAFWRSPKETWTSVDGAAEHGDEGVLETTAQGADTWFHSVWQSAVDHRFGEFTAHFFAWFEHPAREADPEIFSTPARTSRERRWEVRQVEDLGISPEQLAWWRSKVQSMTLDEVLAEYPPTPEAAFQSSGNSWLDAEWLDELDRHVRVPIRYLKVGRAEVRIYEEPVRGESYVIAGDVSEGVGEDEASLVVSKHKNGDVVAVWDDQWTRPKALARSMAELGRFYNNALAAPEIEGLRTDGREPIGLVTLKELKALGYKRIFRHPETKKLGWATNKKTRPVMLGDLADMIERGLIETPDRKMVAEARSMARDKNGKIRARGKHSSGGDDGVFFGWAIGWQVRQLARIRRRPRVESIGELISADFRT